MSIIQIFSDAKHNWGTAMNKRLITAVSLIISTLIARSYAAGPTLSRIPDIIISDKEENVRFAQDKNFFRFLNAFNILNYVQDSDSTPAQLRFAFKENSNVRNLRINGVPQLPTTDTLPSRWGGYKIPTSGAYNYWFSFRDILRSPGGTTGPFPDPLDATGNPVTSTTKAILPWSTTSSSSLAGTYRQVTIFAADETDSVTSDVMNVYSMNAPLGDPNAPGDGFSSTFAPVLTDNTFLNSDWVWTQYSYNYYGACTSSGGGGAGYLGLSSGTNAGWKWSYAYYSRWITKGSGYLDLVAKIPFAEGNVIYCARLQLQLAAAQDNIKAQAPDLRFGAENRLQQFITSNVLVSQTFGSPNAPNAWNPQLPDIGGAAREYRVYWSQNQNARGYNVLANYDLGGSRGTVDLRRWGVFFEIVDADTYTRLEDSGTWRLTSLTVGTLPRPADLATGDRNKIAIKDLTSKSGWANSRYPGIGNVQIVQDSPSPGKITFNANAPNPIITTAALWEKQSVIPWQNGKIIRAIANLSCPTEGERSTFATARIRHFSIGGQVAQVWMLALNNAAPDIYNTLMPDTTANGGTNYEVYVPTYGGPAAVLSVLGPGYDKLSAGFDHIQRTSADAATSWVVNSLQYEVLDDPLGA